jgi:hypothetical protein
MPFDLKSARVSAFVAAPRVRRPTLVSQAIDHDERRFSRRRNAEARAYILAPSLIEPVACLVKDQSTTGARIRLDPSIKDLTATLDEIPENFTLVLQLDRISLDCNVAWRREKSLGVRFTSPARFLPRTAANARQVPVKPAPKR